MYIYRSYYKNKLGGPFFWTTLYTDYVVWHGGSGALVDDFFNGGGGDRQQEKHLGREQATQYRPNVWEKSPPQSHMGRARPYRHVGECTLPLRVLAVACTMRNEALRSVAYRYGTVTIYINFAHH